MSAKKAPKPTSKAPSDMTGAPAKSSSKAPAKARTKAPTKAATSSPTTSKPLRTHTKAASQTAPQTSEPIRPRTHSSSAVPSEVQRKAVRRAQSAGKRIAQTSANKVAGELDEPLIEPSRTRTVSRPPVRAPLRTSSNGPSRAPAYQPVNDDSDGPSVSPQLRRGFAMVLMLVAGAVLLAALFQSRGAWLAAVTSAVGLTSPATSTPIPTATAGTVDAAATSAAANANRIGIISGHRGNDSGAVCPDGLTEAQVNFDVATRVASILRAQGYTVDVLDEFDTRLKGYRARALLSIHADSCAKINELATGYKVAHFYQSAIPDEEDKLVECVSKRYQAATGLRFHHNTVTHDMLQYHAFREIDLNTPSAIIELGFLNLDRRLLTRQKDTVAKGVSEGLLCYLNGETP